MQPSKRSGSSEADKNGSSPAQQRAGQGQGQGSPSPNTPTPVSPHVLQTPQNCFKVTVRPTVSGQSDKVIYVLMSSTVFQLKIEVEKVTGVPPYSQLLLCNGQELKDDEKSITEYGVKDEAVISLSVQMSTGVMRTNNVPSDIMETIFFQPIVLPESEDELKKIIRGMDSLQNHRKKKKRVPSTLGDDKWTAEKQKEMDKTRSKMKELLRKKKKNVDGVGSEGNPQMARVTSSSESNTSVSATSSIDMVIVDPTEVVTDKELKAFFLPPETKEEYHRIHSNWCLPPQNAAELEQLRERNRTESKNKCPECHRKLRPVDQAMACRCGHAYCPKHRNPEEHRCQFDMKHEGRRKIEKENKRVGELGTRKAKGVDEENPKQSRESP
ncbi:hypothetical protein WR25_00844 [Diploscapter pachys]|uniref:Ubiquitin-like domain-containing protein n=1 Tax=Diploscapter pachys TaxID=2018661 RepID=A0A2A2JQX5_9BILA|nr:hypothetical protein WR25_00844 [Diploscapter pachys]